MKKRTNSKAWERKSKEINYVLQHPQFVSDIEMFENIDKNSVKEFHEIIMQEFMIGYDISKELAMLTLARIITGEIAYLFPGVLNSPNKYISFAEKEIGPSFTPKEDFKNQYDPRLLDQPGYVYVMLGMSSTKDEFIEFINKNWGEISKLRGPYVQHKSKGVRLRKTYLRDIEIYQLRKNGKSFNDIAEIIDNKYYDGTGKIGQQEVIKAYERIRPKSKVLDNLREQFKEFNKNNKTVDNIYIYKSSDGLKLKTV